MKKKQVLITSINEYSPELDQVIALADKNVTTLGFVPKEVLRKFASSILVASRRGESVCGYIWFSHVRTRDIVRIHHLCVNEGSRACGVGRALVDALKERTKHRLGIMLNCRRDYLIACEFWKKNGFVPIDEQIGKGKKPKTLTQFWYSHEHSNLFTERDALLAETTAVAVIDANVFFDLHDTHSEGHELATSLRADWLGSRASLWITSELYNEIDRHSDQERRSACRRFAQQFRQISVCDKEVASVYKALRLFMPPASRQSDQSDIRHLAAVIAGKADFFITRDSSILKAAPEISEKFPLSVVSPLEFILRFDQLHHKLDYQPSQLSGSDLTIRAIRGEEIANLRSSFLSYARGEKKGSFDTRLHAIQNKNNKGYVVCDRSGVLGVFVLVSRSRWLSHIVLFRIKLGRLAPTLARHLLAYIFGPRFQSGQSVVVLTDPFLSPTVREACTDLGFLNICGEPTKINLPGLHSVSSANTLLRSLASNVPQIKTICGRCEKMLEELTLNESAAANVARVERLFWPLKINTHQLKSFIVPIKANWARELFDASLAEQGLFAVDRFLALQYENVYYRSAKPQVISAPSRALWYVSKDGGYAGTGQIKAVSQVEEVIIGAADGVFKACSRLGIYSWRNVLSIARDDPSGQIMAFRFKGTEPLVNPINRRVLNEILRSERGVTPQLTTTLAITAREFERILIQAVSAAGEHDL